MGVVSCGTTMLDQGVFENIGAVTWDTTVKTSGFTGVSGNGYFCNTTSAAFTVTLPASPSAGDIVGIKDYANTADTNNITIGRNSSPIQGTAADFVISTEGGSVLLVYIDGTKGWLVTSASQASDIVIPPAFVTATGGTITCSGDYKIHTFTGPGTFCVSCGGNACGSNTADYMVIAGGGGSGIGGGGGGGAGGFRESSGAASGCYSVSPLGSGVSALPLSVTAYPITVGAGGAGIPVPSPASNTGDNGSNSIFSTITSAGGGGGSSQAKTAGSAGGSGGGGGANTPGGGAGNTPPVSPPQGSAGGNGAGGQGGGGGGGATAVGANSSSGGAVGGAGATTSISTSPTVYGGGGGGGSDNRCSPGGAGGAGGGGTGGFRPGGSGSGVFTSGTANTGGGAGGVGESTPGQSNGGSGIVIIRYKFQ
jgi:hypothetical protein